MKFKYVGNYETVRGIVHAVLEGKHGKLTPACENKRISFSPDGKLTAATKSSISSITCSGCRDFLWGKEEHDIKIVNGSASIIKVLNKHLRIRNKTVKDTRELLQIAKQHAAELGKENNILETKIIKLEAELKAAKDKSNSNNFGGILEYEITPATTESEPADSQQYFIIKSPQPCYHADGTLHNNIITLSSEKALLCMIERMAADRFHIPSLTIVRGNEMKVIEEVRQVVSYSLVEKGDD